MQRFLRSSASKATITLRLDRPLAAPRLTRHDDGGLWLHQDDLGLWLKLGERALADCDGRMALNCWRYVCALCPDDKQARLNVGLALLLMGEPSRACLLFDSLSEDRRAPAALRERARRLLVEHEPGDD